MRVVQALLTSCPILISVQPRYVEPSGRYPFMRSIFSRSLAISRALILPLRFLAISCAVTSRVHPLVPQSDALGNRKRTRNRGTLSRRRIGAPTGRTNTVLCDGFFLFDHIASEFPFARLVGQPMTYTVADVIQNCRMLFPWRWAQNSAALLEPQSQTCGRAQHDPDFGAGQSNPSEKRSQLDKTWIFRPEIVHYHTRTCRSVPRTTHRLVAALAKCSAMWCACSTTYKTPAHVAVDVFSVMRQRIAVNRGTSINAFVSSSRNSQPFMQSDVSRRGANTRGVPNSPCRSIPASRPDDEMVEGMSETRPSRRRG